MTAAQAAQTAATAGAGHEDSAPGEKARARTARESRGSPVEHDARDEHRPGGPLEAPPALDHKLVGSHLRQARKTRGLTLAELSERSGIAVSTISKAERGDIALTYDKFAALAHSLELEFDAIFGRRRKPAAGAMKPTFTASGKQQVYDTPNYEYGMLANNLTGKRMVPMRAHIRARAVTDFPDYIRHSGEEFVFLLGGKLELRFENGKSFKLTPGDSLYFDSSVGHVYLSLSDEDAEVLVCCVDSDEHRPNGAI